MRESRELVTRLSGHRSRRCYGVLCCAVEAACRCYPQEPQMKELLKETRILLGTMQSQMTLAKSLSRAAEDIWLYGDRQELERVYGRWVVEQPTPRELVLRMAEYLRRNRPGPVEYEVVAFANGYGIAAHIRTPEYHAVTCPISRDRLTAERIVARLTRERTSIGDFQDCYLQGTILQLSEE